MYSAPSLGNYVKKWIKTGDIGEKGMRDHRGCCAVERDENGSGERVEIDATDGRIAAGKA